MLFTFGVYGLYSFFTLCFMCVYVCVYVCTYVLRMNACPMCVCVYVYIYIYIYVCVCVCVCVWVCTYTRLSRFLTPAVTQCHFTSHYNITLPTVSPSLSHSTTRYPVSKAADGLQITIIAYWISSSQQLTGGSHPAWGLGESLTITLGGFFGTKGIRIVFGTWNGGSRCRSGSLRTAANELQNYRSVVLGVQKVQLG